MEDVLLVRVFDVVVLFYFALSGNFQQMQSQLQQQVRIVSRSSDQYVDNIIDIIM